MGQATVKCGYVYNGSWENFSLLITNHIHLQYWNQSPKLILISNWIMWCVLIIENKVELAPSPFYIIYIVFLKVKRGLRPVLMHCVCILSLAKDYICEHITTVYVFYLGLGFYMWTRCPSGDKTFCMLIFFNENFSSEQLFVN